MTSTPRAELANELLRGLAAALRSVQLYAPGHPLVGRSVTALADTLARIHSTSPSIAIGIVGEQLVVGDIPVPRAAASMDTVMRQLKGVGLERIVIDQGVQPAELTQLIQTLGAAHATAESTAGLSQLRHLRVGRLQLGEQGETAVVDIAAYRRLYNDAVSVAGTLWDSAQLDGMPDPEAGRGIVDSLAEEVSLNRTALLALTALKDYDSYTFTHMVNVSILTMGQARGLGIEGPLLRQFGLSALLHDIGKVKTPDDILKKPEKLTDQEFDILRRHPVEGAEILRRTPDMPALAPVVAFEHHLRLDGTGYPAGLSSRPTLNLGTMLCGIADVYDAMRSQRAYQEAFPTDRILAVLQRNDGAQFDQNLVRRFVQLIGIYPAGNMVRLDTGEIAVVVKTYAPDPYRPRVRLLLDRAGASVQQTRDVNLWEAAEGEPRSIQAPVDPADYDIDPLTHL